jgi:ribosomal protein S2
MIKMQILTYLTLLCIGTHVGHSIANSYFYTRWASFVCVKPFNLVFMNLFKSIILARTGFLTLDAVCEAGQPIWFVDLDPINRHYQKYSADLCGEFNWQGRWVAGAISNYETFRALTQRLLKKERLWHNARQKWFVGDFMYWIKSRFSWPRYVFTHSVHTTYPPVREAFYLGVPCFGVVDTNTYSIVFLLLFQVMMTL